MQFAQFSNETKATKYVLALLVFMMILVLAAPGVVDVFGLVPGKAMKGQVWSLLTASFCESSAVLGVLNMLAVVSVAPALERSWGTAQFVKLIVFTSVVAFACMGVGSLVMYAVSFNDDYLFGSGMGGFAACNAAMAVGLAQKFPDHAPIPAVPKLQMRFLPFSIVLLAVVLSNTGVIVSSQAALVFLGAMWGWHYMRFHMLDTSTGLIGDLREDFSCISLLPPVPVLTPLMVFVSTLVYKCFLNCGCYAASLKSHETIKGSGNAGNAGRANDASAFSESREFMNTLGGGEAVDGEAERRRQLAIKAIDDKLAELEAADRDDIDFDGRELGADLP
jgi:membrane associated rhomboid family serine protease